MQLNLKCDTRSIYKLDLAIGEVRVHLLTLESFKRVENLLALNPHLLVHLQDEIFLSCLASPLYLKDMYPHINAGIVSSIADAVYSVSGPQSIELLQQHLDTERIQASDVTKQMIMIICRAFPGYTPDDLFDMDWQNLVNRFVIAERMLLDAGILTEPMQLLDPKDNKTTIKQPVLRTQKPGETVFERGKTVDWERQAMKETDDLAVSAHDKKDVNRAKQEMLEFAKNFVTKKAKEQKVNKG